MRQSKTLLAIDESGSKISRNSVFNCHLSPVGDKWHPKTLFLSIFDSRLSIVKSVFDCRLPCVIIFIMKRGLMVHCIHACMTNLCKNSNSYTCYHSKNLTISNHSVCLSVCLCLELFARCYMITATIVIAHFDKSKTLWEKGEIKDMRRDSFIIP